VNGSKKYFLASDKWPTWVAALGHSAANVCGAFAYNLDNPVIRWAPEGVVVDVCDMTGKGRPGELKIGVGNKWFYLAHTSWKVAATISSDDPGVTGGTTKELANAQAGLANANTECMMTAADHEAIVAARNEESAVIAEDKATLAETSGDGVAQSCSFIQLEASAELTNSGNITVKFEHCCSDHS